MDMTTNQRWCVESQYARTFNVHIVSIDCTPTYDIPVIVMHFWWSDIMDVMGENNTMKRWTALCNMEGHDDEPAAMGGE